MKQHGCALCDAPGGRLVFQGPKYRVIHAAEAGFPAFYRLVWTDHVAEFSDLPPAERHSCMDAVTHLEQALRKHLRPAKVNLASLGNLVAHLHWHVVARFEWDSHFPGPVWAAAQRQPSQQQIAHIESLLPAIEAELALLLAGAA
jgi:diadenosine tetraphosphate (Ap4A) HIT family hydrolase